MSESSSTGNPGGGGPISSEQAKKMIKEYKEKRLPLIKNAYGIDDTTSVWFKKEVFEEMLNANPNVDGIRIYFGVNYEGDLNGHQNVVLVGTKANPEENLHAVDDDDSTFDSGTLCPPGCLEGENLMEQE